MSGDRRERPERRTGRPITPGSERRARARRRIDFGAPPPSAWAHLADLLFFRSIGLGILVHEVLFALAAQWSLIMAAVMMFFMPDVVRGRNSLGARIVLKKVAKWAEEEE